MASELEARVTSLETTVKILGDRVHMSEHDAAAARVMAGGAERGIVQLRDEMHSDLNALREQNNRLHNATRADLTDLRGEVTDLRQRVDQGFAEIDQRFANVDKGFAEVDKGFANVRGRLDAAAAGQEQIVTMLTELIRRQDAEGD